MSDKIMLREDIDEKDTWNLSDIFESDDEWESSLEELSKLADKLSGMQGEIKSARALLDALMLSDELSDGVLRVYAYAKMHRDEDNSNAKYQGMTDRAARVMTECASKSAYLVPEITKLGEETVNSWTNEESALLTYKHYFHNVFRESEHVLSAEEEKILANTAEIGEAASEIFEMWNHADLVFDSISDENGEEVALTHGRYARFLQSRDRRVRSDAFRAVYRAYSAWGNTLSAMMSANVKKTCFFSQVRRYASALEMALSEDNIETKVYDNLIDCMHKGIPALNSYLELRRELLCVDELHMYDLHVPMVSAAEKKYTFEEAKELVLNAVAPLGEQYVADMKKAFEDRWIDVYENKGKTSGAYSWGCNDVHPFVLLNFDGKIGDVFTLAHEMGHAMHSYYTNMTQPSVYKNYKIFVAEVASTVNENLLMEYLLKTTDDKNLYAYLLGHRLEEFRTTVFRQTMFAEFERETHAAFERGESLTAEYLCDLYYKLNKTYMGDAAVIDEDIKWEWARIPHFYSDFYVYQYATGYSAAVALAKSILSDKTAAQKYREFLKSGDCDYPLDLLASAGVDLREPEAVLSAIEQFSGDVAKLKELCGK